VADVTPRPAHPRPSKAAIDFAAIRTPRWARARGRKPVRAADTFFRVHRAERNWRGLPGASSSPN